MSRRTLVFLVAGVVLAGIALAAVFLANRPPSVLSRHAGLACIAERCTGAADACAAAANAAQEGCIATVADQCSGLESTLQRLDCERDARRQCRNEAGEQVKVCSAEGTSCYASCGPMARDRPHNWCTGDVGDIPVSFFCEGDPANPRSVLICTQRREWQNLSASLTCVGL